MDSKITIDRRKFLERFAKLSTATVIAGVCVACPIPGPGPIPAPPPEDYMTGNRNYSILLINIDGEQQTNSSLISTKLSIVYIEFTNSSISLDNQNLIKITDEYTETLISFTQEKIDDKTLKLTLDDNQLNYGSYYSISVDDGDNITYRFETTPIKLSKEKLSLALDTQEEIIVEGLYIEHEMVSDFNIVSVENSNNDYKDGKNGEVIASIENEIITIKGTKQGKVMLEVVVADKVEFSSYKANLFVEVV